MGLTGDDLEWSLRITKRLVSKGVAKSHHKQPQTIAGWFATHDRGKVKDVLDDMVADSDTPLVRKGRGTVTLLSIQDGKRYLEDNGRQPPSTW